MKVCRFWRAHADGTAELHGGFSRRALHDLGADAERAGSAGGSGSGAGDSNFGGDGARYADGQEDSGGG